MEFKNFGKKAKEAGKKILKRGALVAALGAPLVASSQNYHKLSPDEVRERTENAKSSSGREGGGAGSHNLTNPDFAWTQNADSEKKTHALLLGKYQKMGVAKGVSEADFQRAYEDRDTDTTFDDWAQEYASRVNKPMPSGRVELVEVRKPLIRLTEEQKHVIETDDTNYDLMTFSAAWAYAKKKGIPAFRWKGNDYGTSDDVDYSKLKPGQSSSSGGGGYGGGYGVPNNARPRDGHKTTESHVESVKPKK